MSQFGFLHPEWPNLHAAAMRAEMAARSDPQASAFHARRWLELAMAWLYRADARLSPPWKDNLAALLDEPTFRLIAGQAIYYKAVYLKDAGNRAVHGAKPFTEADARAALGELFHLAFWLVRTYAKGPRPPDSLRFEADKLPPPAAAVARHTQGQLRALQADMEAKDAALQAAQQANAALDAQVAALRAEVAAALAANAARPDTHDYNEAETRDRFIDKLLRDAGWDPQTPGVAEVALAGLPAPGGTGTAGGAGGGRADYVLWGADGKPLAVVEAKATRHGALRGQQQAKLYADALEARHGQRPVIFCTNGYEHWIWDDAAHPPRMVQGFYRREELELLVQRRATRRWLADAAISGTIVERHYQTRAIRRVAEAFEGEGRRKALLVMATGAGKTRTVIALCDLLMRCNWAKRVLFLADRTALVTQAANAFKAHLPESAPVNLQADRAGQGRVYVATYPTMLNLIDEARDGEAGEGGRRFGPGFFDLVIVDEAHRSIYNRYGAIFRWFDALLVGLTATPKDEVDRNTYGLFDLEAGVPTDAYPLEEAVADGFLVPMRAVSVPLRFPQEGIRYDALSDAERERWDEMEWDEDGPPDRVDSQAVNRWLFNADTVDKVLRHLMTHGQMVEGGDRLGKTIVFARNHRHAEFIQARFDANYPKSAGQFARVIDNQVERAPSLIDAFSNPGKAPHIAVSVDMLDTGIDVPEVVNLVFFKPVRSRTKFWQMVGRGTRLRPDLFGPGQPKRFFSVFDFCGNLEFFSQDGATAEGGAAAEPLSAKLFRARLELVAGLDARLREDRAGDRDAEGALRREVAGALCREVAAMNVDNFIVRPHRMIVERFARFEAWGELGVADRDALSTQVAGLPGGLDPERMEAKGFDLLLLGLQLGVLTARPGFDAARERLVAIAGALAEMGSIPAVAAEMALILEVQGADWWEGVTVAELDRVRRRLRGLVQLIRREAQGVLYTDFADEIGEGAEVVFERFVTGDSFARFREKARQFFRAHGDHIAVQRLRRNQPLTPTDLAELERMLLDSGTGTLAEVEEAKGAGLGLFVRGLVGLDRAAAQEALAAFLQDGTLTASQIEFLQILVENLTSTGVVDPGRLYEAPYTRFSAQGVDGVFPEAKVGALIGVLREVEGRAVA